MTQAQRTTLYILVLIASAAWITISAEPTAVSTTGKTPAPQAGFPAPDFTLRTPTGEIYTLSELNGQAVLVNFWATWCPPCRKELPMLLEMARRNRHRLQVWAVSLSHTHEHAVALAVASALPERV